MNSQHFQGVFHEWLVTDQQGAFAMGTSDGRRVRQSHGFYMGIAGRLETAFLADFELVVGGVRLWGASERPEVAAHHKPYPTWIWDLTDGRLALSVAAHRGGGIALSLGWIPTATAELVQKSLKFRPIFALRDLGSLGGQQWSWELLNPGHARIMAPSGTEVRMGFDRHWKWTDAPKWHRGVFYPLEFEHGEADREDLYSAGELSVTLGQASEHVLVISEDPPNLERLEVLDVPIEIHPVQDFILRNPPGIVAGYPWFGEWGRDTFIALPGIVSAWLRGGGEPSEVWRWCVDILSRWGESITSSGMLPSQIEKEGTHQWDSADATLWWCHSLAALWQLSLGTHWFLGGLKEKFHTLLGQAIHSIQNGRHHFLNVSDSGLLEVTEPHTTWMNAQVGGIPVTPRRGVLPEINALWFQARCLHAIWSPEFQNEDFKELESLGHAALSLTQETERPNRIFLHSIPLAPSFVLKDKFTLEKDLGRIERDLWTPFGLRSLSPDHPDYRAQGACHQGLVWGWLGGHYEMARARNMNERSKMRRTLSEIEMRKMPIRGHIAQIFDAEEPFAPRGAPAQATSLSCLEEDEARRRFRLDAKLTRVLALRWVGREARQGKKKTAG